MPLTLPPEALPIGAARWAELPSSFGALPKLTSWLAGLSHEDQRAQSMEQLWGYVHHQGDVYDLTLWTVPHVLLATEHATDDTDLLAYAASVLAQREESAVPESLVAWCVDNVVRLAIERLGSGGLSDEDVVALLAASVVDVDRALAGRLMLEFTGEELMGTCPVCESEIYIWPTDEGLAVSSDDPVGKPSALRPVDAPASLTTPSIRRLVSLAALAGAPRIAEQLQCLDARTPCPDCGETVHLLEAVRAY
ncbi:MAG: hypothetical protein KC912_15765 [Proteobacteria bacterium]|nr:hypothetical protein [Pseudomonadota bacterium]